VAKLTSLFFCRSRADSECKYKDPSDDGAFHLLATAKGIDSLAFGTLVEALCQKTDVMEAVAGFFARAGTWFHVVDRDFVYRHLEQDWKALPAEVSLLVICMVLVDNAADHLPRKGIKAPLYQSAQFLLGLAETNLGISVRILQAQLLLAQYQFAQTLPREAYRSLGDCIEMARMLGWFNPGFWVAKPDTRAALQWYSILWHTIVNLDK
jgi:hypothetical protein